MEIKRKILVWMLSVVLLSGFAGCGMDDMESSLQSLEGTARELLGTESSTQEEENTEEEAAALLDVSQSLPQIFKKPFFEEIKKVLSDKGFVYDGKTKRFHLKEEKNDTAA